jgi:hypothetical protein
VEIDLLPMNLFITHFHAKSASVFLPFAATADTTIASTLDLGDKTVISFVKTTLVIAIR